MTPLCKAEFIERDVSRYEAGGERVCVYKSLNEDKKNHFQDGWDAFFMFITCSERVRAERFGTA